MSLSDLKSWTASNVETWIRGISPDFKRITVNDRRYTGGWLINSTTADIFNMNNQLMGSTIILMDSIAALQDRLNNSLSLKEIMNKVVVKAKLLENCCNDLLNVRQSQEVENPSMLSFFITDTDAMAIDNNRILKYNMISTVMQLVESINSCLIYFSLFSQFTEIAKLKSCLLQDMRKLNSYSQMIIGKRKLQKFSNVKENALVIRGRIESFLETSSNDCYLQPFTVSKTVSVDKMMDGKMGFYVHTLMNNLHLIRFDGPKEEDFYQGILAEGDEILEINNQTVVGWCNSSVVGRINSSGRKISLRIRRMPKIERNEEVPWNPSFGKVSIESLKGESKVTRRSMEGDEEELASVSTTTWTNDAQTDLQNLKNAYSRALEMESESSDVDSSSEDGNIVYQDWLWKKELYFNKNKFVKYWGVMNGNKLQFYDIDGQAVQFEYELPYYTIQQDSISKSGNSYFRMVRNFDEERFCCSKRSKWLQYLQNPDLVADTKTRNDGSVGRTIDSILYMYSTINGQRVSSVFTDTDLKFKSIIEEDNSKNDIDSTDGLNETTSNELTFTDYVIHATKEKKKVEQAIKERKTLLLEIEKFLCVTHIPGKLKIFWEDYGNEILRICSSQDSPMIQANINHTI